MPNESQKSSTAKGAHVSDQMAEQLLSHLSDEKASLTSMLNAVREVHSALLVLNEKSLKNSLDLEKRELSVVTTLMRRRRELQTEFATKLNIVPQDVTLGRLISMISGSLGDSIGRVLQSVNEMIAEIDRLNRQNAAMIRQSLSIVRGVIERVTGSVAIHESYSASGTRVRSHVGPLIQWGG